MTAESKNMDVPEVKTSGTLKREVPSLVGINDHLRPEIM